jgi:hypothetical protein
VVPPVEAESGAGVAEVDRAVRGFDRRVCEPGGGRPDRRAARARENGQRWLYNFVRNLGRDANLMVEPSTSDARRVTPSSPTLRSPWSISYSNSNN